MNPDDSVKALDTDDERAERVGRKLIEALQLQPVMGFTPTRYATAWGTKTAQGIARTAARILLER